MELKATTTVTKPPEEMYGFWASLDRFPSFMAHMDDVQMTDPAGQLLDEPEQGRGPRRPGSVHPERP
jgi:hypothetical protein